MKLSLYHYAIAFFVLAIVAMMSLNVVKANRPQPAAPTSIDGMTTTKDGLIFKDDVIGSGKEAEKHDRVSVNYVGTLYPDGHKFDSSYDRNQPFDFRLGAGQVIAGWDEGVAGMRVGGKRTLIIPAGLAYGHEGAPPVIPPDATLKFTVELLDVQ